MLNDIPANGPIIIGATGGSGTRAFAELLIKSGEVYLGKNHNPASDCLDFKTFYDEWIPKCWPFLFESGIEIESMNELHSSFEEHFNRYLKDASSRELSGNWGWKGPRSMFLLPFWDRCFSSLRFVHILRDGRDMAYSRNQNQLLLYGGQTTGGMPPNEIIPEHSIDLWSKVNIMVSEYGKKHLGNRYLCIRYEDLIAETEIVMEQMAGFLNVDVDMLLSKRAMIRGSAQIGRWKLVPEDEIERVVSRGREGLYYFGYL